MSIEILLGSGTELIAFRRRNRLGCLNNNSSQIHFISSAEWHIVRFRFQHTIPLHILGTEDSILKIVLVRLLWRSHYCPAILLITSLKWLLISINRLKQTAQKEDIMCYLFNNRRKKEGVVSLTSISLCVCVCLWHPISQTDGPISIRFAIASFLALGFNYVWFISVQ